MMFSKSLGCKNICYHCQSRFLKGKTIGTLNLSDMLNTMEWSYYYLTEPFYYKHFSKTDSYKKTYSIAETRNKTLHKCNGNHFIEICLMDC